jgi:hypothetical protein
MLSMIIESSQMDPIQRPTIQGGETIQSFHGSRMNQGGALHHAYQAPNQDPALMSQSLEETLRDFMKMTGQSINDVRNTTIVNTQSIAKLETQMGQLASHLGERDKGKFPSQPMANPKAFTIGNSSSQAHGQEHVHGIVTLRFGRQVGN